MTQKQTKGTISRKKLLRKSSIILFEGKNFSVGKFIFSTLFNISLSSLIVIVLSLIFSYRYYLLSGFRGYKDIPIYFENFGVFIEPQDVLNKNEEVSKLLQIVDEISQNLYFKNFFLFMIHKHKDELQSNIKDYLLHQTSEIKYIPTSNEINIETCKTILKQTGNNKLIALGRKDLIQKLKIVCNKVGTDIEYLATDALNGDLSFDSFSVEFIKNLFFHL